MAQGFGFTLNKHQSVFRSPAVACCHTIFRYKQQIRTNHLTVKSSDLSFLVTRAGIEPTLTAWEAAVLTAWPTGHLVHHQGLEPGTPWLRVRCSTNWANGAYGRLSFHICVHSKLNKGERDLSESVKSDWPRSDGQALGLLVLPSWTCYHAYTRSLSTL